MSIFRRITNLFFRGKVEREIHQELAAHIQMRVEDNIARGMSARAARRDALVRFGNPVVMRERTMAADAALLLESIYADVRFALRQLAKSPGFAVRRTGAFDGYWRLQWDLQRGRCGDAGTEAAAVRSGTAGSFLHEGSRREGVCLLRCRRIWKSGRS